MASGAASSAPRSGHERRPGDRHPAL